MPADIAETGRTQQGITQGMQHHIAIRVCLQTAFKGNGHAAQHQRAPVLEGMHIEALPDSHGCSLVCR
jgi:hypothetical protein